MIHSQFRRAINEGFHEEQMLLPRSRRFGRRNRKRPIRLLWAMFRLILYPGSTWLTCVAPFCGRTLGETHSHKRWASALRFTELLAPDMIGVGEPVERLRQLSPKGLTAIEVAEAENRRPARDAGVFFGRPRSDGVAMSCGVMLSENQGNNAGSRRF